MLLPCRCYSFPHLQMRRLRPRAVTRLSCVTQLVSGEAVRAYILSALLDRLAASPSTPIVCHWAPSLPLLQASCLASQSQLQLHLWGVIWSSHGWELFPVTKTLLSTYKIVAHFEWISDLGKSGVYIKLYYGWHVNTCNLFQAPKVYVNVQR